MRANTTYLVVCTAAIAGMGMVASSWKFANQNALYIDGTPLTLHPRWDGHSGTRTNGPY